MTNIWNFSLNSLQLVFIVYLKLLVPLGVCGGGGTGIWGEAGGVAADDYCRLKADSCNASGQQLPHPPSPPQIPVHPSPLTPGGTKNLKCTMKTGSYLFRDNCHKFFMYSVGLTSFFLQLICLDISWYIPIKVFFAFFRAFPSVILRHKGHMMCHTLPLQTPSLGKINSFPIPYFTSPKFD